MNKQSSYLLPVLLYHRIVKSKAETGKHNIYVTVKRFRRQMEWLRKNQISTITFRDIIENPDISFDKKVILTFDDGYNENYFNMFPIIREFGFNAVIFLVTQQHYNSWGVIDGEPNIGLLTNEQIIEMDKYGIEFGSHTQNHFDLTKCNTATQMREIAESKRNIESSINKKVVSFSYPFGGLNEEIKNIIKEEGYNFGVATKTGPVNFFDDLFQIRRIEVHCKTMLYRFKKKVSGNYYKR